MINKIISFSLKNKLIILLAVLAMAITGILEFKNLPIDAVPDITNNQVQIITTAPSYAAQDIERKVTFPIEQACSNIKGIKEIRSFSRFGLSLITIVFEDDIDIYWARQQVAERLQSVKNQITENIGNPELAPITTGLGEIYQYIVRPEPGYETKYTLTYLREIQDWIIRRQLLGTKGVADVSSFGGKLKQYEIAIHPYALNAHQISISDIFNALERNNQNTGSAYIEKNSTAYFIRSEAIITSIEDIENIVVKQTEGDIPLQIKDIAKVKITYAPRYGALLYTSANGTTQYETAGGIVMMLKGENSNKVIEHVKQKISEIQNNLPEGVVIEPFLDRTKMVNSTIRTVFKNLLEGAVIVIVVLVLFLGNIRFGLLVASVIPLSMLFTVIMMNIFKVSGNLMSLGALDFGLIVDGTVIITEGVLLYVALNSKKMKINPEIADKIVFDVSSKLINASVFGQIIILIVYIPVLYFTGIEGKMFRPMAQTVIFALTGAFLLSVTYIPVMCSLLSNTNRLTHFHFTDKMMNAIEKLYLRLFKIFFRKGKILVMSILLLFFISIYVLLNLGGEFMPVLEEGDFAVETRLITGSGLSTTIEYCKKASKLLAEKFPDEVQKIVNKVGSGEIPTDPMPIESADMMVILHPMEKWKKAQTFDELAMKMQQELNAIPGIATSFQYPVQMRFNELIAGAKQDVVCKIFGENIDSLSKYAHLIAEKVRTIKGTEGIYEEPIFGQPQIFIQLNREKLAQYNLNVMQVNQAIQSVVAGTIAGKLYQNERSFDIVIRTDSSFRDIESVENILVFNENTAVPLRNIADVKIITDVNQIQREEAKRRIIVGFNVRGRDVESVINELKTLTKQIHLPPGYFIKYGGSFENLEMAKQRLMITVPVAIALIMIMLYFAFSSVSLTLLIFTTIPMSVIGGIFFLYFRQIPFSVSTGVGFIALFGIAVLNGIVLISEFKSTMHQHTLPLKIILKGIKTRLRPVLMTATVAALGFLPMFLNTGIGANVQRPLATVVIGGLFSSTILTLFILPVLFYHFILKKKSLKNSVHFVFLAMFFVEAPHSSYAQTVVNYQTCIDSVLKNNLQLKMQQVLSEYQKELTKTAWTIDKTNVNIQYGQFNSAYLDNAIQVQQHFAFPSVYTHQKKLLQSEWTVSELKKELEKRNIKNTVGKLFYDLVIVSEKIKLFKEADSIYNKNLQIIELQFQKGNISELEKNAMQNMIYENKFKRLELENTRQRLILLLQLLTGIKTIQDIEYNNSQATINLKNTLDTNQHPLVLISKENILIQTQKVQYEKSKLLPDFNIGYNNLTLTGWGSDDKFYPASRRFQYVHAGVGIPLFSSSYIHKIKAEQHLIRFANYQYEWTKNFIQSEISRLFKEYETNQKIIFDYEHKILPNINKINHSATLNYQAGNITFMEWSYYIEKNIQIKSQYLDLIQQQNQIIFEINYYINN